MTTEIVDLDETSSINSTSDPPQSLNFVYPPDGLDSVRLTESDLDTLALGEYVNDNIINFYLRFLTQQENQTVHCFSSFFYSTLVSGKTLNYERVQTWTKRVNLFDKECLIVPIIQNMHWRLAIVGFPGLLFAEEKGGKKPYLVCFDSFVQGHDFAVSEALLEYLRLEWESRNGPVQDSATLALQELTIKHPMQSNETDCGLFVLEFAERFLKEKDVFHEAAASSDFLDRSHWFTGHDAEQKRYYLKWLVRVLSDGREFEEVAATREVYFMVPHALKAGRRRKRRRFEDEFQYY